MFRLLALLHGWEHAIVIDGFGSPPAQPEADVQEVFAISGLIICSSLSTRQFRCVSDHLEKALENKNWKSVSGGVDACRLALLTQQVSTPPLTDQFPREVRKMAGTFAFFERLSYIEQGKYVLLLQRNT